MRLKELDWRIKSIRDYLAPRLQFCSDEWPKLDANYWPIRWMQEYLMLLEKERYAKKRRSSRRKSSA